jgi:hypothetical protein
VHPTAASHKNLSCMLYTDTGQVPVSQIHRYDSRG